MNRVKCYFCLFLFTIAFMHAKDFGQNANIINNIASKDKRIITNTYIKASPKKAIDFLDFKDKNYIKSKTNQTIKTVNKDIEQSNSNNSKPIIYIFNTHQTEEYKQGEYLISPTVMTASFILQEELSNLSINSFVEEKDIIEEVKKRGYDYSGTYTISFEYLKVRKKSNPSLKYFFDLHRDSITGSNARITIDGKKYATMMFLIGANHKNYRKNLKNVNIMKKYLDKNYKGVVRSNFIQRKWAYNQGYSPQMFLVEIGGPDNTLEEVSNTTKVLAEAIQYYVESEYEK